MPWTPEESKAKTKRANTPAKQKRWAAIADRVLAESGDEGKAIRIASGIIKKTKR